MLSLRPYQTEAAAFLGQRARAMVLTPEWSVIPGVWDYVDGHLYWKINCGRGTSVRRRGDRVVVKPDPLGYHFVTWRRKHYAVHRVVFLLVQGWLPDCVDHIDNNPRNNTTANLRAATRTQNQYNRRKNINSENRVKNVSPHQGKWQVRFSMGGKTKHFGCFEDIELAELVAQEVRSMLHREFARHA